MRREARSLDGTEVADSFSNRKIVGARVHAVGQEAGRRLALQHRQPVDCGRLPRLIWAQYCRRSSAVGAYGAESVVREGRS